MDGSRQRDADEAEAAETDLDGSKAAEDRLARLIRDGRVNAVVAWAMLAVLVGVLAESALDADLLAGAIVVGLGAVVLAPTVAARDWRVMLPAELVGLALLPVLVRVVLGGELGTFATYVAIAAVALVITVDLHMFTSLRVTHWFAVVFVVLVTLATAGVWAVLRWTLDRTAGTEFLTTNDALMIEWMYVTLAGLAAGLLFDGYFRRRGLRLRRAIRRVVRR
ncbi:MAG: hypothetical protein ACOC06_08090 [Halorubrum sp.]